MKRLIAVFFTLIFFTCCSKDSPPASVIPQEQMVSLLTDIHLVDGYTLSLATDSVIKVAPVLYQSVFKKHSTDSLKFSNSLQYYSKKPQQLDEMYKQVKQKLVKLQQAEDKRAKRELLLQHNKSLQEAKRLKEQKLKEEKRLLDQKPKLDQKPENKAFTSGKRVMQKE